VDSALTVWHFSFGAMKTMHSVVIADDHAAVLQKVSTLLRPRFAVAGTARDGRSAISVVVKAKPDVVILDINMPLLDGFAAAREIKKLGLPARIVFLTMHDDPAYEEFAIGLGASALVLKSRASSDLVAAVDAALAGEQFFSREARIWLRRSSGVIS
jgi:DNA-binding NarL/FixJ family response regulator